jgi:hypothetical protein
MAGLLLLVGVLGAAQGQGGAEGTGPPPGLGVLQGAAGLAWRNANCGGSYSGEVDLTGQPAGTGTFVCASHNYTGDWQYGLR